MRQIISRAQHKTVSRVTLTPISGEVFLDRKKVFDTVDHQLFFNEIQLNMSEFGAILRSGLNLIYLIEPSLYIYQRSALRRSLYKVWGSPGLNTQSTPVFDIHK